MLKSLKLTTEETEKISRLLLEKEVLAMVDKGKWGILMYLYEKHPKKKKVLFDLLRQTGRYIEAHIVHEKFKLKEPSIEKYLFDNQLETINKECLRYPKKAEIFVVEDTKQLHMMAKAMQTSIFPENNKSSKCYNSVEEICDDLCNNGYKTIVGLDAEWKPNVHNQGSVGADILQVSMAKKTFIIDLLAFKTAKGWKNYTAMELLTAFINNLLTDEFIVKLCFDFSNEDFKMINKALHHKLTKNKSSMFDFKSNLKSSEKQMSLSDLTRRWLGKKLSKIQQCSDWSRRPLSEGQKAYASLDSHCMLAVLDLMLMLFSNGRKTLDIACKYYDYIIEEHMTGFVIETQGVLFI